MPLGKNVRFRWKTNPDGTKVRLAFRNNKVIEVKKKGGKAHRVNPHPKKSLDKNLRRAVLKARAA